MGHILEQTLGRKDNNRNINLIILTPYIKVITHTTLVYICARLTNLSTSGRYLCHGIDFHRAKNQYINPHTLAIERVENEKRK